MKLGCSPGSECCGSTRPARRLRRTPRAGRHRSCPATEPPSSATARQVASTGKHPRGQIAGWLLAPQRLLRQHAPRPAYREHRRAASHHSCQATEPPSSATAHQVPTTGKHPRGQVPARGSPGSECPRPARRPPRTLKGSQPPLTPSHRTAELGNSTPGADHRPPAPSGSRPPRTRRGRAAPASSTRTRLRRGHRAAKARAGRRGLRCRRRRGSRRGGRRRPRRRGLRGRR